MNKNIKYSLIFLILSVLLIFSTSMVSADEINDNSLDVSNNIITDNVGDNQISSTDNTESQTIEKEVDNTIDANTTATSDKKELIKDDKNLKEAVKEGTLTLNTSSAKAGEMINIHIYASGTAIYSSYDYDVTVKLNDTTFYTGVGRLTSSRNGDTEVEVPDFEPGEYVLYMEWNYRNGFRGAYGSAPFTIIKTLKNTTISDMGTVNGEINNTVLPITVTDVDGNPVTGISTITVSDDESNVLLSNYQINGSTASVDVPTNKLGDYTLTVEYAGNDGYNPSRITVPVSVSKSSTTLIVDQADEDSIYEVINALNNTLVSGRLVQTNSNKPMINAPIRLTVNNEEYAITTDNEGKYIYHYPVTEMADNVPFTIQYMGNDLYFASEEFTGSFDTEILEVNIELDEVTLSEVNETTTISGRLTDNYNNPVSNADINLVMTGVEETVILTTDDDGIFTYDVVYHDVEDVTVTASIANSLIYEAEDATTSFNVIVGPKRTNLIIDIGYGLGNTIDKSNIRPFYNELITYGMLTDIFNEPVVGASINISINDEDYSQITDDEGHFYLYYNATLGQTIYNISVNYLGNESYKPSNQAYTGTFTTDPFNIELTFDDNLPDEMLVGDVITITGSATIQDQPLKNNRLRLSVDGKRVTVYSDDEGKFSYNYTIARNGNIPFIITAAYENASIRDAEKVIYVDKPLVVILLDRLQDTTVLSDVILNGRILIAQNGSEIADNLLLKINNNNINIQSNENGQFTYTYTPQEMGEYNITLTYQTQRYQVQDAEAQIHVVKRQSQLISDKLPIAVKVHDTYKISGKLIDNTTASIKDADIIITIDGQNYTTKTDSEGLYSYEYITNTVQDNIQYEVRYSGDNHYILAKEYVGSYFDVEAKDTKITIDVTQTDKTYTITGKLTSDKKAVSRADIELYFDDEIIQLTTDENGIYTYEYTLNQQGTHTAYAKYTEEDNEITSQTQTFTIKITTITKVNTFDTVIGKDTSITANVTDSDDNPVTGGKVVFKVNGKTIKDANGKVIYCKVEDGIATLADYTIPESWSNGVELSAVYSGTTGYPASRSDAITVTARIAQAALELTPENITAARGETVTITATVADESGNNMNGGKVILKLNGKTIKDANGKALYLTVEDGITSYDYTIPENLKIQTFTLTAVFTKANYEKLEDSIELTVVKEKANSIEVTNDTNTTENSDNGTITKPENQTIKTDSPTTHIINNDNIDEYITADGLSDLVLPGDTLDIQGLIDKEHSLVIDKPINVISSTHDAIINLHTVGGSLMGEDPGNSFVVNNAGSGSNISGLYLNNTECWMYNNYDVTLYNMTMHVENARVGSGVGQTSIRYCERFTMDSCYIYTEANGGSSSFVLTGSSDVLLKNTTVEGRYGANYVGNILYFGNPYNKEDMPENFTERNTNITVIGCTLLGDCEGAITELVRNFASHCNFINNTINASGTYGVLNTGAYGNAYGNTFYGQGRLVVTGSSNASENKIYGTGNLSASVGANVYNNYISNLLYDSYVNYTNNTIVNVIMYDGMKLENQTILGNVYIDYRKLLSVPSHVTIVNNTIGGNIEVYGGGGSQRSTGNQIINNNISGNISIQRAHSTIVDNNTINGTVTVGSNVFYTNITNNTIITENEYAISNTIASTIISNNTLISDNYHKIGNDAINGITNSVNVTNNGPDISELYMVTIEEVDTTVGADTTITVTLTTPTGDNIDQGEVYLMINDDIITDEYGDVIKADVMGNQAFLYIAYVPEEWLRSDAILTAVYTYENVIKTNNITMNINKRDAEVIWTTDSLTITTGQTVTLTAEVYFEGNPIDGQLAFKVNGKSLIDDEGNLICVDVIDGVATLEYTFDDSYEEGSYELIAVFKNDTYYRSTDSKTLIIE